MWTQYSNIRFWCTYISANGPLLVVALDKRQNVFANFASGVCVEGLWPETVNHYTKEKDIYYKSVESLKG